MSQFCIVAVHCLFFLHTSDMFPYKFFWILSTSFRYSLSASPPSGFASTVSMASKPRLKNISALSSTDTYDENFNNVPCDFNFFLWGFKLFCVFFFQCSKLTRTKVKRFWIFCKTVNLLLFIQSFILCLKEHYSLLFSLNQS